MNRTLQVCAYACVLLCAGRANAVEADTYIRVIRILNGGAACFGVYDAKTHAQIRTFGPGCED